MDELVHSPFPLHISNDSPTPVSTQTTQAIWRASQAQIINSGWWAIEGNTLYKTRSDKGRMHGIETNPYPLPNDDEEIVRLDELQFVIRGLFGRNILAPINRNPTTILDLGTGSGRYHPIVGKLIIVGVLKWQNSSPIPELWELTFLPSNLLPSLRIASSL
jgi:hypothetical protein